MEGVIKEALLLLMAVILLVSIASLLDSTTRAAGSLYFRKVDLWRRIIASINQKYGLDGDFTPPEGENW